MIISRQALCRALTRCITRLSKSRRRHRVNRACLEFLMRTRAVLLPLSHHHSAQRWTYTRRLLILIDPVSAGLWPHLRRNRGLTAMQRFAQWIVLRANPGAKPAVSLSDWRHIARVFGSRPRIRARETHLDTSGQEDQLRAGWTSILNYHTEHRPTPMLRCWGHWVWRF